MRRVAWLPAPGSRPDLEASAAPEGEHGRNPRSRPWMVGENEVGTPGREAMQSSDKGSTLIELLALIGVSLAIVTTVSMAYKQTLQVLGQVQMRSKYLYALDNASEQVRSYADSLSRPLPSEFSIQSPDAAENIICKLSAASPVAGYYECRFPAPSFAEDEVKLPLTRLYRVALP